jgi:RNA polymerase sigma-70 factor (ECF subfamily)
VPITDERILNDAYYINEDFDLITAAQAGNGEAFGEIYRRYAEPVTNRLVKLCAGNRQDAEDLAQETFTKAVISLNQLKDKKRGAGPWLQTIAHRTFIDDRRSPRHRILPTGEIFESAQGKAGNDAIDELIANINFESIIADLSPPLKAAVLAVYGWGLRNTEAGELLNVSRITIGTRLLRSCRQLEQKVKELN